MSTSIKIQELISPLESFGSGAKNPPRQGDAPLAPWPNTRTHPPVDGEVAEALRRMTRGRTSRHGQVSSLRWSSWARHVSPRAPRRLGWLGWLPPTHIFGHVDVALGFISLRQLKAAPAVVVESHSSFFPKCYTTSTKDAFLGSFAEAFIGTLATDRSPRQPAKRQRVVGVDAREARPPSVTRGQGTQQLLLLQHQAIHLAAPARCPDACASGKSSCEPGVGERHRSQRSRQIGNP